LFAKRLAVGDKELEKCTRPELKRVISKLRAEYMMLKDKVKAVEQDTGEQ
tara:strand:+ start:1050 stop:1199 length:150 start_codon:yes stop_codon:yes gene_type:complete